MKLYQVYDTRSPHTTETWYPYKREAMERSRSIKNSGGVPECVVHEFSRLNRREACRMLTNWPKRGT